jgi:hypothetical protein
MSDLEDLQGFENDVMHYIAIMDRASVQLQRTVQGREMALMAEETRHLRDNINGMGYKLNEYITAERRKVLDDIDKESKRK